MATIEEFARKIKEKYPQYQNVNDRELGMKMLEKYPEYKAKVFDTDPQTQQEITGEKPTAGIWDAIKKGGRNIVDNMKQSGDELYDTGVLNSFVKPVEGSQAQRNSNVNPFIQGAKVATTLTKGVISPITELAISTPLRVGGELVENATGYDINEATAKGVQNLVQKGIETKTAQKAMEGWAKLKETDPESAMALSAILDIGQIASEAIGLKGASVAKKGMINATETTGKLVSKTGKVAEKTGEYVAGQAYGFKPETVSNIIKNPEMFTKKEMAKIDRDSIFNKTKSAIDKRLEGLSETGKEYEGIKKLDTKANVSEKTITDLLGNRGIRVEDGKIKVDLQSDIQLSPADAKGLEEVLSLIRGKENLTAKEVLNLRTRLSNLSKFGEGKTDASKLVAREIRKEIDNIAKKEIPGLADLDAKFAPERQLLSKIKKTIFNADGTIKDNAVSKIATLTGKGKEKALERMEKIIPGLKEDLNILKSIEDIEYSKGQKVGTYMRTGLGVGTGAVAGGPLGAIVGAIVTSPQVGVSLLRAYGKAKNIGGNIIDGIIKKMKSGKKLVDDEVKIMNEAVDSASKKVADRAKNMRPGLNIQDVNTMTPAQKRSASIKAKKERIEKQQIAEGQKMVDEGPSAQYEKVLAKKEATKKAQQEKYIGIARSYAYFDDFRKRFPKADEKILRKVFALSRKANM
jgi:hypothetical protein